MGSGCAQCEGPRCPQACHRVTQASPLWGARCRPTWGVVAPELEPATREFVRAVNGKSRRHLTLSQLAAAEVALWEWAPAGKPNSAPGAELATAAQMATAAGVSVRTIQDAKTVAAKATPEVQAAVKAGTMSVKEAAATTKPAKPAKAKPAKTKPAETTTATLRERDDAPLVATVTTPTASQAHEHEQAQDDNNAIVKASFQGARRGPTIGSGGTCTMHRPCTAQRPCGKVNR